jgi:hypothetical protein
VIGLALGPYLPVHCVAFLTDSVEMQFSLCRHRFSSQGHFSAMPSVTFSKMPEVTGSKMPEVI